MIYRVTAKFSDTEAAQRAARRINSIKNDVYEVRLGYMGEKQYDSPIYCVNNVDGFPPAFNDGRHLYSIVEKDISGDFKEISDECVMTVFCKDGVNSVISEAIINCGGYSLETEEEKLL